MCAKVHGVPDVIVGCILHEPLTLHFVAVDVDGWRGSVGHVAFGYCNVAYADIATLPVYGEGDCCFA